MNLKQGAAIALTTLGLAGTTVLAQQTQPAPPSQPPMMGPGMMGGQGPGYGPRYRDDGDWGWGMMRGRGGWGMGPGMMGGMGMMGLGPIGQLDLSDSQRQQVLRIEDDLRRKDWDLMGKMQDEMAKMRDAMWSGKRDRAAILAANKRMSDLRLQMLENSLDARDNAEALLTPEQRDQLRRMAR